MFCCSHRPQLSTIMFSIVTPVSDSTILFNIVDNSTVNNVGKFNKTLLNPVRQQGQSFCCVLLGPRSKHNRFMEMFLLELLGYSRGFAFVEFLDMETAKKWIEDCKVFKRLQLFSFDQAMKVEKTLM